MFHHTCTEAKNISWKHIPHLAVYTSISLQSRREPFWRMSKPQDEFDRWQEGQKGGQTRMGGKGSHSIAQCRYNKDSKPSTIRFCFAVQRAMYRGSALRRKIWIQRLLTDGEVRIRLQKTIFAWSSDQTSSLHPLSNTRDNLQTHWCGIQTSTACEDFCLSSRKPLIHSPNYCRRSWEQ